jgi:hypothetical protein
LSNDRLESSAKANWLKEQERVNEGWAPAFDSSQHDVETQALNRLYEAEWALSERDFLLFSVGVEKVIHLGFNEFLLSEGEGARLTNMPRSRVRRGLKALSTEGVWIRRRSSPRSKQNKKSWAKEQGKGWGKLASVYYIPLHGRSARPSHRDTSEGMAMTTDPRRE